MCLLNANIASSKYNLTSLVEMEEEKQRHHEIQIWRSNVVICSHDRTTWVIVVNIFICIHNWLWTWMIVFNLGLCFLLFFLLFCLHFFYTKYTSVPHLLPHVSGQVDWVNSIAGHHHLFLIIPFQRYRNYTCVAQKCLYEMTSKISTIGWSRLEDLALELMKDNCVDYLWPGIPYTKFFCFHIFPFLGKRKLPLT